MLKAFSTHQQCYAINLFCVYQLSRAHREHYCDKTGSVLPVEHFKLPAPVEDAFKKDVSLYAVYLLTYLLILTLYRMYTIFVVIYQAN